MFIAQRQHLEAVETLTGQSRVEAKKFLIRLQARSCPHSFWGNCEDSVVLILEDAGSVATCIITPPTTKNKMQLCSALIAATEATAKKGVSTAHAVLGVFDHASVEVFESVGFTKLAILRIMEWKNYPSKPTTATTRELKFIDATHVSDDVFCEVLKDTYIGSLDCPLIHGKRNVEHILASHRGHEKYDPTLWFLIELNRTSAGVLFLHKRAKQRILELDYLGVSPWARRKGVGEAAILHAVNLATVRGCKKITLVVDDTNKPAIRLYKKTTFKNVSKRIAMFCQLS